jgi:ankyrin repeat protein
MFNQNCRFGACTPIQYAAYAGALESVKFLKDQGANPWRLDMYGRTALSYAIQSQHGEVAQYLRTLP